MEYILREKERLSIAQGKKSNVTFIFHRSTIMTTSVIYLEILRSPESNVFMKGGGLNILSHTGLCFGIL